MVDKHYESYYKTSYLLDSIWTGHGPPRLFKSNWTHHNTALSRQERVVGLHVMGPNAGDILQGFVAAMKCGLTKSQLDATVGILPGSAQVSILFFPTLFYKNLVSMTIKTQKGSLLHLIPSDTFPGNDIIQLPPPWCALVFFEVLCFEASLRYYHVQSLKRLGCLGSMPDQQI